MRRRTVLIAGLAAAGLATFAAGAPAQTQGRHEVGNVTGLYTVRVARIARPTSVEDVVQAIRAWPGRIAVGGGRYSMGGQIAIEGGLHLDMRGMDRLVWLDPVRRIVRVQAGMRWRDLQDHLDPVGLSVRTMQSYANFTVGGSVSVNAHGRYVGHGPVVHSVRALQLVLADGRVVELLPERDTQLFAGVAGGYGALGVITEVELDLDINEPLERRVERMPAGEYAGWFAREMRGNDIVLHNADLLPPHFEEATAVSWARTDKPVTEESRLVPRGQDYKLDRSVIKAVTEWAGGDELQRRIVRPALLAGAKVVWRNYEASLDTASLEPHSRDQSTYVLQEYFVPVARFDAFVHDMVSVIRQHRARVLNVSIRHSPPDRCSLMAWAREEVFCFVLYYHQGVDAEARGRTGEWTRALIAAALRHGGTYYLPYQLHATREQFDAAYPRAPQFRGLKEAVDPQGRFGNQLWARYL